MLSVRSLDDVYHALGETARRHVVAAGGSLLQKPGLLTEELRLLEEPYREANLSGRGWV